MLSVNISFHVATAVVELTELRRLREQLKEGKKVRMKLEYDLEHTHAADNKKAKVISELTEKLEQSDTECRKVSFCLRLHVVSYGECFNLMGLLST